MGQSFPERKAHSERLFSIIACSFISITVLFVYLKTIHFDFVFDDYQYIVENLETRSLSNFWPPLGTRYLGLLSFALNYAVSGLEPEAFRAVNIVIHGLNSILLYFILTAAFRAGDSAQETEGAWFSLLVSLTFAAHPINTQAVTYIAQRFASLATLFYLSSIFLYMKWRGSAGTRAFYIASLVSAALAQWVKEISFTLPFAIAVCEFFFFDGPAKKRLARLIPFFAVLLIIPINLLVAGTGEGAAAVSGLAGEQLRDIRAVSPYQYLITQGGVIITYLRLMVLPVRQSFFYNIELAPGLEPRVIISFLFLAVFLSSGVFLLAASRRRKSRFARLASFGVFFFFITLSVESSAIPIKDLIFEHRMYLPGIGVIIFLASLAFLALESIQRRSRIRLSRAALAVILVTVLPLSVAANRRNDAWRDHVSLCEDMVRKDPGFAKARYCLGVAYQQKGRMEEAVRELRIAIELDPGSEKAHVGLGNVYADLGYFDLAAEEFRRAVELNPSAGSYFAMGLSFQKSGRLKEAAGAYREAVSILPDFVEARLNLGNVYLDIGLTGEAIEEYEKALLIRPDYVKAYLNLGEAYRRAGEPEKAMEAYGKFIELAPEDFREEKEYARSVVETLR